MPESHRLHAFNREALMPQTLPLGNARRGRETVYEGDQGVDRLTFLKIAIEVAHFRSGTNECLIECGVGVMMTSRAACVRRRIAAVTNPSCCGIEISNSTSCGRSIAHEATAAGPLYTGCASRPAVSSAAATLSATNSWSSTTTAVRTARWSKVRVDH